MSPVRFASALNRALPFRLTLEEALPLDYGRTTLLEFSAFPKAAEGQVFHPFTLYVRVNESWEGQMRQAVAKVGEAVRRTNYRVQEPVRLRALTVELGERAPRADFV